MIRLRPNEFRARPPQAIFHGTQTHPGFHTTGSFDRAAGYALFALRETRAIQQDDDDTPYVDDYPVVVGLDMRGLHAVPDYDAAVYVRPILTDLIQYGLPAVLVLARKGADDEQIAQAVYDEVERGIEAEPRGLEHDAYIDALGPHLEFDDMPYRFRDLAAASIARAIRAVGQKRPIPDDVLIAVTDQYRYDVDVPESRIVSVDYIKPLAPDLDEEDEDEDGGVSPDQWEARGFNVVGISDLDYWAPRPTRVYEARRASVQIEYHGTLYSLFRQAAPERARRLPPPPMPPWRPSA